MLRIALAQINTIVGDLPGNQKKIVSFVRKAKVSQADIVVFPELAVCGYPPEVTPWIAALSISMLVFSAYMVLERQNHAVHGWGHAGQGRDLQRRRNRVQSWTDGIIPGGGD